MIKQFFRPMLLSFGVHLLLFSLAYWVWRSFVLADWMLGPDWDQFLALVRDVRLQDMRRADILEGVDEAFVQTVLLATIASFLGTGGWFWSARAARIASESGVRRMRGVWLACWIGTVTLSGVLAGGYAYFEHREHLSVLAMVPLAIQGGVAFGAILLTYWSASIVATPRHVSGAVPLAALFWAPFNRKPRY